MWSVYDFKTAQQNPVAGKPYLSERTQIEYDCKGERSRILYLLWHSGQMASGEVVYDILGPDKWIPVSPGSVIERLSKFACSNASAAPEWARLGETEIAVIYVAPATIRRIGSTVTIWELYDYKTAQRSPTGEKLFSSMKTQTEYECQSGQSRTLFIESSANQMGAGETIYVGSGLGAWRRVISGSIEDVIWKAMCGKK